MTTVITFRAARQLRCLPALQDLGDGIRALGTPFVRAFRRQSMVQPGSLGQPNIDAPEAKYGR